jgi:PKD repeat protein
MRAFWGVLALVTCLFLAGFTAQAGNSWLAPPPHSAPGLPSGAIEEFHVDGNSAENGTVESAGTARPSTVTIVPATIGAPETCANGTPSNPFPVSFLPTGYETPNLFGLGSGSQGLDDVCYTGGTAGEVSNEVNFSNVGGAEGVLGFPHVEYGQDLWGGSPGNMSPGFELPEPVSSATNSSLWLTNTYSINDSRGSAAYDYVWDNFLSSYIPNPGNVSGPTNYSLEVMLWMSTGLEGSPFTYFPYEGTASLPTMVNTTLSNQPWDFSHFCQGTNNNELTVLYFYNGTGGAMNASGRTLGVNFSAVLFNLNQMIRANGITCWSYPNNNDAKMYLDDLNLGSEFLTPFPSPYYGQAIFNWTLSSMCFTFPEGTPTVGSVSCSPMAHQPLGADPTANPLSGPAPLQVDFSPGSEGGIPPYTYNWSFGDGAVSGSEDPTHTYDGAGEYGVNLTVKDSNGSSVMRRLTIDVTPPALRVGIVASATSGLAPLTVLFTSTVIGGVRPYVYHWELQATDLGSGANLSYTFQTAGSYSVGLWVNDSATPEPRENHTAMTVVVLASSARPGPLALSNIELLALGGAILALACGLLFAIQRRRPPPANPPELPRESPTTR